MQLKKQVDKLVNQILSKVENQHKLLFGDCQSGATVTNIQEHILMPPSQERLTNSDLAKRLNTNQAAVTKAIKYLMNQGALASMKNKEDVRVIYFELTDIAKSVAKEHTYYHDVALAVYKNLFNQFSNDEQGVIARFLKVLSDGLEG